MGKIKTSISIEENVSSAFKSMNTVVSSTLGTFKNFDSVINNTPTMNDNNATILNSISNASNNASNSLNNTSAAISSIETINNSNESKLNSMATGANNATNSIENMNNAIDTSSVSTNVGNWTSAVGNYSKSALEAIYTTEELVEMGFKTTDALKEQESSVTQVDNAVSNLKNDVLQWSSMPSIELFNSTGVERYNQEINSAQTLMNQLIQKQTEIQNKAKSTNILSSTAQSDFDNLNVRVERLQTAMQELEERKISSLGADEASTEVEELREKINNALKSQNDLNEAMQNMDPGSAYSAYSELKNNIKEAENEVNNFNNSMDDMNTKINTANNSSGSLLKTLLGFSAVQSIFSIVTNQLDSAIDRMDTMTNFSRTMTAITGSSEAAELSLQELTSAVKGTAYGLDVAASATQNFVTRGMGIATATNEVSKWADAVAFYGEGTNEQLESVTDALGKMLSKGTVSMEYLNTLTDAGINAVGIYAQATGQASSTVQDALSAGEISAYDFITTVSTAFEEGTNGVLNISGAAKEAGATWATSIANMKAAVTRGLVSMIDSINNALTNAGFGTILDGITNFGITMESVLGNIGNAIGGVITLLAPMLNLIQQIGGFVYDNWSVIAPIIMGIVEAIGLYNAALGLHAIYVGASTIAEGLHSIATYNQAKALLANVDMNLVAANSEYALAVATAQATVAQTGFNTALLACPITWIIIAIIALIAIISAVIVAVNKAQGNTVSAIGVVCGVVAVAGAIIINIVIGLINAIIAIVDTVANVIISVIEWVLNVCGGGFDSFGDAVANLIGNIISWFLDLGTVVTRIIDAIFGTNWTAGLQSLANTVSQWGQNDTSITLERWNHSIDTIDYSNAYNSGYNFGEGISNMFSGLDTDLSTDTSSALGSLEDYDISNLTSDIADTATNTGSTASSANSIADSLDITEEDLKYLRDLAEQEVINRFTTAEINVEMNNNNNINSEMDLDGVVSGLEDRIYEMTSSMAEGVHS